MARLASPTIPKFVHSFLRFSEQYFTRKRFSRFRGKRGPGRRGDSARAKQGPSKTLPSLAQLYDIPSAPSAEATGIQHFADKLNSETAYRRTFGPRKRAGSG